MKEKMLSELLAMRARIDDLISMAKTESNEPAKPEPTWMKVQEFCARWSISRTTFYDRVAEGLPVVGGGQDRRVNVKLGDEWMERRSGRARAA